MGFSFMNKVFVGDCRGTMKALIAEKVRVQMCVTSPPYWGLRDYGIEGQLGMEETPEAYVENMVEVFGLVHELLVNNGTLWLNLGDSYAGSGCGTNDYRTEASRSINKTDIMFNKKPPQQRLGRQGRTSLVSRVERDRGYYHTANIKPKDLVGIPWMVAFALRNDGWYLRQDIIWSKPNPMPESVKDRCTKSHEYIFLFGKSQQYYFDQDAIKEPSTYPDDNRKSRSRKGHQRYPTGELAGIREGDQIYPFRNKRSVWTVSTRPYPKSHFATFPPNLIEPCILAGARVGDIVLDPFFGSGTTGQVAESLGRKWIGCEINEQYRPLWEERTRQMDLSI